MVNTADGEFTSRAHHMKRANFTNMSKGRGAVA